MKMNFSIRPFEEKDKRAEVLMKAIELGICMNFVGGSKKELHKPGATIKMMSDEQRKILSDLKSDDLSLLQTDKRYLMQTGKET